MKFLWPPHSNFMWVFRLRFILYVRPHCGHMSGDDGVNGIFVASCGFRNPYANPANEKETMLEYFFTPETPCETTDVTEVKPLAREAGQAPRRNSGTRSIACTMRRFGLSLAHAKTLYYVPVARYAHYENTCYSVPKGNNNEGIRNALHISSESKKRVLLSPRVTRKVRRVKNLSFLLSFMKFIRLLYTFNAIYR